MTKKLNPDQLKAVNIKDTNTLVFASAGAGKTTVLVERLKKRILEDRINLDQIIAMTFTEAAATNIKKRLEKELRALLEETNDPFITKQLSLLPSAHISTIHSFCLSIIKEYYYLINIPKDLTNNILNEVYKNEYLHKSFSRALLNQSDLKSLNQVITSSIFSFDTLENTILILINKANSFKDPIKWLNEKRSKPINKLMDLDQRVLDQYFKMIKDELSLASTYLDKLIDYCKSLDDEKYYIYYNNIKTSLNGLILINDYEKLINEIDLNHLKYLNKIKDNDFKTLLEPFKASLKRFATYLMPTKDIINIHNKAIIYEDMLIDIAIDTLKYYKELKLINKTLDFDDFEHYALAILEVDKGRIGNKLKSHYKEIMIDEFQDTSNIQYMIASKIANNNLFLVGDIKQSIYRFRGALPKIMQSLKTDKDFEVINIKNNYRSKSSLIKFNNHLFSKLMNIYHDDFIESDLQIPGIPSQDENNIDIYFYNILIEDMNEKESKAKFIANDILKKHQAGLAFKDIAILARSHNDKKLVKEALDNLNIPCFIEDNYSYFNSKSINLIASFLRLCIDEQNDIAKVSILSSDMFKLSDDQLLELSKIHYDYEPLKEHLKNLKMIFKSNQLTKIISYIININHYYDNLIDLHERSNIDLLLIEIATLSFNEASSLLYYIEDNKDTLKGGASVISSEADVVKMMTIHKSKGLEFDTVYLYSQANNPFNETKDPIIVDDEIGIGLKYVDYDTLNRYSTIKRMAIREKNNIDDLLEYNRLLYVATTRPKRQLIIIDSIKDFINLPLNFNLLSARKGFSNLIYNIAKDYEGMHLITIAKLDSPKPLAKLEQKEKSIEKRPFKSIYKESISPSSLKNRNIDLNLNLKVSTTYGTRLHHLFEMIDYNQEYDIDKLKHIDNDFNDETYVKILNFLNSELILRAKQMNIYQEYSYYYKKDNNYYHGFIDFLAYNEKEAIIIDYKSDHLDNIQDFIERYSKQLLAYQELIKQSLNINPETYIYSIYLDQFIKM